MVTQKAVVAYTRVSSASQVENGDGLEIQRRKIQDYCKEKGITLEKVYEDGGFSGAIKDRPGLLQLLKDCENGRIERVITYKYDRLARELSISIWVQSIFKRYGVEVSTVADPEFINDDPITNCLRNLLFCFADMERSIIVTRLRDGRYNNAKNGERGSGAIPFGYKKVEDKLEINPDEAQWVEKIFRWRARGFRYAKITKELNKCGVKTKRNGPFNLEGVKYIIGNPLYSGAAIFGDVQTQGIHPVIISRRLFLRVQKVLDKNKVF